MEPSEDKYGERRGKGGGGGGGGGGGEEKFKLIAKGDNGKRVFLNLETRDLYLENKLIDSSTVEELREAGLLHYVETFSKNCQACGKTPSNILSCDLCLWSTRTHTCFCDEKCFKSVYLKEHIGDCLQGAIEKVLILGTEDLKEDNKDLLVFLMKSLKNVVVKKKLGFDMNKVVHAFIVVTDALQFYNEIDPKKTFENILMVKLYIEQVLEHLNEEDVSSDVFFSLKKHLIQNKYLEAMLWIKTAKSSNFMEDIEHLDKAEKLCRSCFELTRELQEKFPSKSLEVKLPDILAKLRRIKELKSNLPRNFSDTDLENDSFVYVHFPGKKFRGIIVKSESGLLAAQLLFLSAKKRIQIIEEYKRLKTILDVLTEEQINEMRMKNGREFDKLFDDLIKYSLLSNVLYNTPIYVTDEDSVRIIGDSEGREGAGGGGGGGGKR